MPEWLDASLYPDQTPPDNLVSLSEKTDFLARLCSAWDFGILPYTKTIQEIRKQEWLDAVETCRLLTSSAYHLLRSWHGLIPLPYLGTRMGYIYDDESLMHV